MAEKRQYKETSLLKYFQKKQKVSNSNVEEEPAATSGFSAKYCRVHDNENINAISASEDLSSSFDILETPAKSEIFDAFTCENQNDDSSTENSQDIINDKILSSKMSVYKLVNSRIKGLSDIPRDIKALRDIIVKELEGDTHIQHHELEDDESPPFYLTLFFYLSEQEKDIPATQIASHRKAYTINDFLGNRNVGSILVYYRFKGDSPEVFFLCSNTASHAILHLSDPFFRTQVAKHYMDANAIKELETINIAGADIASKTTYKEPTNIAHLTSAYLEKAILNLSGAIEHNSKLYRLIQEDNQNINIEVGLNYARICKYLSYEMWAKVLKLFSDQLNNNSEQTSSRLIDALDYVQRVDPKYSKNLSVELTSNVIKLISERTSSADFYLSHRYWREWIMASSVALSIKHKPKTKPIEIKFWNDTPSLVVVIKEIHDYLGPQNVKEYLDKQYITLSYIRSGKTECHPIQDYVHGHVINESGSFYKVGQKWYRLSSSYSEVVDRNFKQFVTSGALRDDQGQISELLKYPWNTKSGLTFGLPEVKGYFEISADEATKLCDILLKKIDVIDVNGVCILTESSCLLPISSQLHQALNPESNKGKEKKKKLNQPRPAVNLDSDIADDSATTSGVSYLATEIAGEKNKKQIQTNFDVELEPNKGKGKRKKLNQPRPDISLDPENTDDSETTSVVLHLATDEGKGKKNKQNQLKFDVKLTPDNDDNNTTSQEGKQIGQILSNVQNATGNPSPIVEKEEKSTSRGKLLQLLRSKNVSKDPQLKGVLKEKRFICNSKEEGKYVVKNPILNSSVLAEIQNSILSLKDIKETQITKFLRTNSKLKEGEYCELYLHYDKPGLIAIPGDRIVPNDVELFDILIHDNTSHHKKTYLFHCKETFGNDTRVACAQIRNSSELLWHDIIRGHTTHIQKFWDLVMNYCNSDKYDTYRVFLKEKMEAIGKNKFLEMFSEDTQIIFVYAYLNGVSTDLVNLKFRPFTPDDLKEVCGDLNEDMFRTLNDSKLINNGYLGDEFISLTQEQFKERCKDIAGLQSLKVKERVALYNRLSSLGKCKMSTIAKLELLTLDNCFARYQIGGKRRFELKYVKIKSA